MLTTKRLSMSREFTEVENGLGRTIFLFHLAGHRVTEIPGTYRITLDRPCLLAYFHPRGVPKLSTWRPGATETMVSIGFCASRPPRLYDKYAALIRDEPTSSGPGDGGAVVHHRPLSPAMLSAATALLSPAIQPAVLEDYLSLKTKELLCLGMDSLISADHDGRSRRAGLDRKVEQVKQLLEENTRDRLTVEDLAKQLAIAPPALSGRFLERYGLSIPEYSAEIRMSAAMALLVSTDLPLKRIAHDVGYNHTTNFCLAFKRRFGMTARQARLGGGRSRPAKPERIADGP